MAVPAPLPCAVGICAMPEGVTVMVAMALWGEKGSLLAETEAVLGSVTMHPGNVPTTKSERVELGFAEARVSARKLEKQEVKPRLVRFMPISRNSPGKAWLCPFRVGVPLLSVKNHGSVMFLPFTTAAVPVEGVMPSERWPVAS